MTRDLKNKGRATYRFKDNPEEQRFAEAWNERCEQGKTLDHLLDARLVKGANPPTASSQDRTTAATVIQWLGSPVGQSFLRDLGYVRVDALIEKIQATVPYVTTTINPRGGNTMRTRDDDWIAVHSGRAGSSVNQLNELLRLAEEIKS